MVETAETRQSEFINRAHNDYLEWSLEGGIFSIGLLGAFVLIFGQACKTVFGGSEGAANFDRVLARMSILIIALLLVHSVVDYPLRTTAMMVVFSLVCGILVRTAIRPPEGRGVRSTRQSRQGAHGAH
jgi:O-antigen ligase